MNKCMSNLIVVALVLLMPCLVFALPGAHDPASGNGYTCNTCHVAPATYGNTDPNYLTNVCFTCHNSANSKTNKAFLPTDFADIDNTSAAIPGRPAVNSRIQSSHKWFGPDNNATAKALSPTDTGVNGLTIAGKGYSSSLACVRCHAVHGTSGAESNTAPYLRAVNDVDQLCMNCHRPRANTTHILGSHPVNISYTSASVKAKPGQYVPGEPITNPTNPTAVMKNKKSIVVCSSCHGVHVTDSNSATLDNYTSSKNGTLTVSDGSLLRVSKRGANNSVATTNICTNCHIKTHSGQTQQHTKSANIQCMDCHNAHVDETDPLNSTPNTFLLRRFVNWSGVKGTGTVVQLNSYRKRLVYTASDAATANWSRADGTGVCQACHALPNSVTEHTNYTLTKTNCVSCHINAPHTDSYPSGNCTDCHGQPPQVSAVGSPVVAGYASGYTRYTLEATTPHLSHAGGATNYSYACADCHTGNVHNNGTSYIDVFNSVATKPGAAATYTANTPPADSTCNTVYCHSDGTTLTPIAANFKAGQLNIGWNNGKIGSIIGLAPATRCVTCHDNTTITTGSHAKHASTGLRNYGCVTCHNLTVSGNTTLSDKAYHANAVKDVQFTGTTPAVGSFTAAGKTCSITCHNNGKGTGPVVTPAWGNAASGACGACHATKTNGNLATNGHAAHLTAAVTTANDTSCVQCHTGYTANNAATHVNGTLETPAGCSVNSCHGTIATPTWTASFTGKDSCTKCHGTLTNTGVITLAANNRDLIAPSDAAATGNTGHVSTNVKTGAHETHLKYLNGFSNYSTVDYRCQGCHGVTTAYTIKHANGSSAPDFTGSKLANSRGLMTPVWTAASLTCSNTYCHNPAGTGGKLNAGNVGTRTFVSWTSSAYLGNTAKTEMNCNRCHKSPGAVAGSILLSGTSNHSSLSIADSCVGCHGHDGDSAGPVGQRHMDGIKYGNGDCDTCHGYPPMTAADLAARTGGTYVDAALEAAGGGGYHKLHLLPTVNKGQGFTPCLPCHPDSSQSVHAQGGAVLAANVNVFYAADTAYRFDSTRAKRYNKTATATNRTCSNVSCHFQPTPAWY